jgi:hypothetical protein
MIITLCGSARFESAWHYWNERLTLEGHTVFSLAVFPSVKYGVKDWYDAETKRKLDAAHIRKIDASDAIFVITGAAGDERYVGESTRREIAHAMNVKKTIIYSDEYRKEKVA